MKRARAYRAMWCACIVVSIACGLSVGVVRAQGREGAALNAMQARARRVEPVIREAAARYGVDPRILWAIAYLETRFQAGLISPKGARGMMQFMPATAARFGLANPHDTAAAVDAAARYVRFLTARFDNRFDLVLAGYNAGEGAVEAYLRGISLRPPDGRIINPNRVRTGGIPPYAETRNYVARGLYVARALTTANIFPLTDLVVNNTRLAFPSYDDQSQLERESTPASGESIAQRSPAIVTPTSIYALSAKGSSEAERKGASSAQDGSENSSPFAAPRSFRVTPPRRSDDLTQRVVAKQR